MSFNHSDTANLETTPFNLFLNRGEDYEKYRPIHPAAAIDAIVSGLNLPDQLVAADIGAGTGIGSRLLGDRLIRVLAIEPNADMRSAATSHAQVEFQAGTAENIFLEIASVDLVVSFQAFHWFDFTKSLQEFRRMIGCAFKMHMNFHFRHRLQAIAQYVSQTCRTPNPFV